MARPLLLTLTLAAALLGVAAAADIPLTLAGFFPVTGGWPIGNEAIAGARFAEREVRALAGTLDGYNLTFVPKNDNCDEGNGLAALFEQMTEEPVKIGNFGSGCSVVCQPLATLTKHWEIITMSWGCSSPALTNREKFPYFFSSLQSEADIALSVFAIFEHFKWTQHSIFTETEEIFQLTAATWIENMGEHNLELLTSDTFPSLDKVNVDNAAAKNSRVHVVFAYGQQVRRLMCLAFKQGLTGKEFVWILPGFVMDAPDWWRNSTHPEENLPCSDTDMRYATRGSWGVIGKFTDSGDDTLLPGGLTPPQWKEQIAPFIEQDTDIVRLGYDGFWVWANALDTFLKEGNSHESLGVRDAAARARLIEIMKATDFEGISGPFAFSANGMRTSPTNLRQRAFDTDDGFIVVGSEFKGSLTLPGDRVVWGDGSVGAANAPSGVPPIAPPEDDNTTTIIIIVVVVVVVVVLLVAAFLWLQKRKLMEMSMNDTSWVIKYEDVRVDTKAAAVSRSRMSGMSKVSSNAGGQSVYSNINAQVYILRGTWNNNDCALKKLPTVDKSVPLTMELRREVMAVRDCNNTHVNTFMGAILDAPNVAILTEYCAKGSLEDAIQNDALQLDWMFKFSMATDAARGMEYLHRSKIVSHGSLRSSRCLIDSRWVLKIGGFGLRLLKANGSQEVLSLNKLYWTAPELLERGGGDIGWTTAALRSTEGSVAEQAADVYSFGVIMSEIITRNPPFSDVPFDGEDVLGKVKSGSLVPTIEASAAEQAAPAGVVALTKSMLSHSPAARPPFTAVLTQVTQLNPHRNTSMVDNMTKMLEQYSANLEDIVAERTTELFEEKKKVERLISQMLPPKVAARLTQGQMVEPETFEESTIFFSDIVGFTKIAGGSSPLQVVDLLNDLYTCFDAIIDEHDVYKVETIGDAYMVVSGIPERNGNRHAGEISNMALDLLSATTTFKIRHMPATQLQLRIGLHSGPAVAGVVGLKMPRYCLFGDTVNTASRMESGGFALRIHMSQYTEAVLRELGGYKLECRGEIEVKGKGRMTTYWLLGHDNFNKQLPDLARAAGTEEHEFK